MGMSQAKLLTVIQFKNNLLRTRACKVEYSRWREG